MIQPVWNHIIRALSLAGILIGAFQPTAGLASPWRQDNPPPGQPLPNGILVSGPVSPADTRGLPAAQPPKINVETPVERQSAFPVPRAGRLSGEITPDPALQRQVGPVAMPAPILNFEGIGNTGVLPPDTDGQIGPDHYVQIVNTSGAGSAVRVFDKTDGAALFSFDLGDLWPSGSTCNRYGYGDPVVLYDQFADRWLLTQFVYGAVDYHECIAVSKGHTPTNLPDDWWLYDFTVHTTKFNDYPKLAVWPDGYYMMAHQFTSTWAGTGVWVFDRARMINGQPAGYQYKDLFDVNPNFGGMLPVNLMGSNPPPPGSPGYFVEVDRNWSGSDDILTVFGFQVDWHDPLNTTFEIIGELVVADYNIPVCAAYREQCIDQPGGAPRLEAISDRLMMHAWYRNLGSHEAIVLNLTVNAQTDPAGGDLAGIRWYELRKTTPAPTGWSVYQQGTYAPDAGLAAWAHRWMGSIAMDHVGNIALGYSVSSPSVYPSIRYAGRLASDPLNTLPQAEVTIVAGGGAQTHSAARWGDYSAMSVDPLDDCTFWYTNEYVPAGATVWHTRIASFRFPNCAIGDQGTLQGVVTSQGAGAPIADAAIQASASVTQTSSTITHADGTYTLPLRVGVYDVAASAYGYQPQTVSGVEIFSGTATTQDFALTPAITYTISGTVTDSAAGWPLYARIDVTPEGAWPGFPGEPIWTDPYTGRYRLALAEGITYTLQVNAFRGGYLADARTVSALSGNRLEDFTLQADRLACLAPGYGFDYAYFEDFEPDDGGFTTAGVTSWAWGAPTSGPGSAHSGTYAWATNPAGNYGPNESGDLLSPPIDLSAYAGRTPVLEWWQWLKSESNFDRASVEVTRDGGATWQRVYGEVSGDVSLAWARQSVALDPSYAVPDFRLRFHFRTDSTVQRPGWYVDDVGLAMVVYTPPQVYFGEDFEGVAFPPPGWYSLDLDGSGTQWERTTSIFHGGGAAARHHFAPRAAGMQDGWLATPPIDLPADRANLSFWERSLYPNDYFKHSLWICTSDDCSAPPVNFTELAEFSPSVNAWREQVIALDSYAGQTATLAFRYEGEFADAWYLDDVQVIEAGVPPAPQAACTVHPGGLVAGNVYDGNTGSPLVGASLSGDGAILGVAGTAAVTRPTPEDPAVEDGFYTLFSTAGTHVFTATLGGGYAPAIETVSVVLSDTVRQDFTLSAGALAVSPPALGGALELGRSLTATLTLSNTGRVTTTFAIDELPLQQVSGLRAAMPEWTKTQLPGARRPAEQPRNRTAYEFLLGNVYLAARTYEVLILTPDVGSGGGNVNALLAALAPFADLHVTVWNPDADGTPQATDLLPYEVVILGNDVKWVNMEKTATGDALADYIDAGGKVIEGLYTQSHDEWGFAGRYMTGGYSPFTRATRDIWGADQMAILDPAHPLMLGVTHASDAWGHQDPGLQAGASLLAEWNLSRQPYVALNDHVVALNQLLHHQANWSGDVGVILHNAVLWLAGLPGAGVPWLATEPISGTLAPGAQQPVLVTMDAGQVSQPGDYHALLRVESDAPAGPLNVPVTMTVTAPASYGQVAGRVSGLGACDAGDPAPLSGAEVTIRSSAGVTWTVTSGPDGAYHYWLDQAGNPYTLSARTAGHAPAAPTTATVTGGITTTVDFTLRLAAPCLSLSSDRFTAQLAPGDSQTATLAIQNTGAGAGAFELAELPGAPPPGAGSPAAATPLLSDARADLTDERPQSAAPAVSAPSAVEGWGSGAGMPGSGRYRAASACNADCTQIWVFGGGLEGGSGTGSADVLFYSVISNTWTTDLAPIPHPGQNWQAAYIDGKFYLPGGYDGAHHNWLQIYDVQADAWSLGANLPAATTPMAAALDGKLYIFGGNPGPSDQVAVYDPLSDAWTTGLAPMPTPRTYGRAVAVGEYIYLVGGASPSAAVERYHPASNRWESLPDLGLARGDMSLFAAGDYLYAVGGISDYLVWEGLTMVERYDLRNAPSGAWEAMPPAPAGIGAAAFGCAGSVPLNPDRMWSIGGQDENGSAVTANRYLDEDLACACGLQGVDVPWLAAEPATGTVPAGATASIQITFTAQPTMTLGATFTATLHVRTDDPLLREATLPVTMTVTAPARAGVELEPEASNRFGEPGVQVTHTLVLSNTGSLTETFGLDYRNATATWDVNLEQASLTLGPGQAAQVWVRVTIPEGALPGDENRFTLVAAAQSNSEVNDTVELITRVTAHRFYLPFMSR